MVYVKEKANRHYPVPLSHQRTSQHLELGRNPMARSQLMFFLFFFFTLFFFLFAAVMILFLLTFSLVFYHIAEKIQKRGLQTRNAA